jgi:16S rRNA (adenine1518-N6/adenine1519-N6)-dimethyltransferase
MRRRQSHRIGPAAAVPNALPELPPLREVIARHGLGARKSLGQHFLLDLNLTRRIARAAPSLSRGSVIEVGPGPGGLTRALLLEGAAEVIAIERDRRCIAALEELAAAFPGRLEVIEGDALETAVEELGKPPRQIVANLPYNISTVLLTRWLATLAREPRCLVCLVLMFQKEVAARLNAAPRSRDYGRLSVLTQWLCRVEVMFDLPPRAFVPPPKVSSSVVRLTPLSTPLAPARLECLEQVTGAAFGQRRKMLRQSLKSLPLESDWLLAEAGIEGTKRAEELSVEAFCRLARALERGKQSAT